MLQLTVIIPSHNRAELVDQTLKSLAKQSYTDFQIILVDHGSTDHTEEIYRKYKDRLHIDYYKIERDGYSAGTPRHFGVQKATTPLILFLDSGTIVPSWFISAHLAFHESHSGYVGVGMQYRNDYVGSDFPLWENLDLALPEFEKAQFVEVREGIDLERSCMPWLYGWTCDLSMPREAYVVSGGFDLELRGWGFDDVNLCYKIAKHGYKFAFVEEGWTLEIPQERNDMVSLTASGQKHTWECYYKQQGLGLEVICLSMRLLNVALRKYEALPTTDVAAFRERIKEKMRTAKPHESHEKLFRFLTEVKQEVATWPAVPAEAREGMTGPTLLVGGTPQDAEWYDHVTLIDDRVISTPSLWSCCGIVIPLPDQALGTVVVSDVWKKLGWSVLYPFGIPSTPLLEVLLSEIKRTARQAVFVHTSSISGDSVEALENLCRTYNLEYKIVRVGEAQESTPALLGAEK